MNAPSLSRSARFFTRPWWARGEAFSTVEGPVLMVNETATRARAGLLNALSGTTILILLVRPEWDPVLWVAPLVIGDMALASLFGLTPLSPAGVAGTLLTLKLPVVWKPADPKRFAWALGASLGALCLTFRLLHLPVPWIIAVLGTCFALTWLEAVLGFCVGCWMHAKFFGCVVCDVGVR